MISVRRLPGTSLHPSSFNSLLPHTLNLIAPLFYRRPPSVPCSPAARRHVANVRVSRNLPLFQALLHLPASSPIAGYSWPSRICGGPSSIAGQTIILLRSSTAHSLATIRWGQLLLRMAPCRKGSKESSQEVEESGSASWSKENIIIFCDLCIELVDKSKGKNGGTISQRIRWRCVEKEVKKVVKELKRVVVLEDAKFKQFRDKGIDPKLESKMNELFGGHIARGIT
ncbi:hypothetical protein Cgig2_027882 [Carnegiea gigantea]|uniref:Uncharacterized protein n=1 Tax=Carnegiea gigantea TaxID=171969 RepID=A0A9Q1QLB6_9CARY|nr:hypothetical protein Cgig2_027882 [Carnegiea gigantea]